MRMTIMALIILNLAACGGGGGGGGSSSFRGPTGPGPDLDLVRALSGIAAPTESLQQQHSRAPGILGRSDSLVGSTWYWTTDESGPSNYRAASSCTLTTCVYAANSGSEWERSRSDIVAEAYGELIGTKYDITVGREVYSDAWYLGAWMEHSAFEIGSYWTTVDGVRESNQRSFAWGDSTIRPASSATWQGLMVGTPVTGEEIGDRLLGDATLTYNSNTQMLGASFTNIQNIDSLTAHSDQLISFTGIPVDSSGEFAAGSVGNRIQGGFYGSGNVETAGVFEQSDIVGSFGAKRQ